MNRSSPRFSAAQRLIVVAKLIGTAVAPPPNAPKPAHVGGLAGEAGLSGKRRSIAPTVEWGFVAAAIAFAGWLLGRQWRRWPAYLITAPIFLVVLFVFFENFSRILPANI